MRIYPRMSRLLVIPVVLSLLLTACSTSWVTLAEQILAVITPAAVNIVPLIMLADKNVPASVMTEVQQKSNEVGKDLHEIGSLIDQYNAASGDKAAILDKINAALTVTKTNLGDILNAMHVFNPEKQKTWDAIIGIVIGEVGSIEALLPIVRAGNVAKAAKLAKPLTADSWRARYNAGLNSIPGADSYKLREPSKTRSTVNHLKFWK